NGIPDDCDIASGTSPDCNANGVPDECDIASGTSPDANGNGIPDECEQRFVRGDCNADALFNIADPIFMLAFLFSSGPLPLCDDSCDGNDDGALDIADPVYKLAALFSSGPLPPAPHPGCGVDPTADLLGCAAFPPCP
ncbi:MAG: hypothetical protein ACE5GW_01780, partial [Planctomycetota bacterium]